LPKDKPIFWGSFKGRIIKAIVVDDARIWEDLRDLTGLHPKTMNTVLKELFHNSAIYKTQDNEYRVAKDIYLEYKNYFKDKTEQDVKSVALKVSKEIQDNIKRELQRWLEFKKLTSLLVDNHLFLDGSNLDELSKHVLRESKAEIIVVNPFVKWCDLSESLRSPAKSNVNVKLLTRPSKDEKIEEYHKSLTKAGIQIYQNDIVHAKIIVVDRGIVIISSMNFYASSSGGGSWEAGLVSISPSVIEEVTSSVFTFMDDYESILFKA